MAKSSKKRGASVDDIAEAADAIDGAHDGGAESKKLRRGTTPRKEKQRSETEDAPQKRDKKKRGDTEKSAKLSKPARGKGRKKKDAPPTRADKADKYALYQRAVQSPEVDVAFFHRVYRSEFGRPPLVLREDFCGTGAVCCAWAASRKDRRAAGYDLDPEPLAWGRENNVTDLPATRQAQVELVQADVREVRGEKADVVCALNFSFNIFKTREELRTYFQAARANLADEGVFIIDVVGGAETQEDEREESRKLKGGVRYVWEQKTFDPISYEGLFAIHFIFKDGSALNRAFDYSWRLWTIPELRELMNEAGFRRTDVYWEGTDPETGEGDGKYNRVKSAAADPAWVACLAAFR